MDAVTLAQGIAAVKLKPTPTQEKTYLSPLEKLAAGIGRRLDAIRAFLDDSSAEEEDDDTDSEADEEDEGWSTAALDDEVVESPQ
eukprot:m.68363 g.68363  ORF g.68363 m.68363 type:complete len:85 (-) comp13681_c1_seq1:373-627(-)